MNDLPHRPLLKKKRREIPEKFQAKATQEHILWLNLNKTSEISILQSARNQGNPSFHFHAPGSNADTHALKQHRQSQNISPVCSSFVLVIASDMHLESESEKRAKKLIFTQLKISRYNQCFFVIFRPILIK